MSFRWTTPSAQKLLPWLKHRYFLLQFLVFMWWGNHDFGFFGQVCRTFKPGHFYLVDTECVNSGIPYGDNFYVVNRYCLSRVSSNKCRLLITSQIKYRKSVWGIAKSEWLPHWALCLLCTVFVILSPGQSLSKLSIFICPLWLMKTVCIAPPSSCNFSPKFLDE